MTQSREAGDHMSGGAICNGGLAFERRRIAFCSTENKRRRFYTRSQAWYGTTWTCLSCGDSWQDGERGYRPFMRGWRVKAIARARERWAATPTGNRKAAFRAWIEATT